MRKVIIVVCCVVLALVSFLFFFLGFSNNYENTVKGGRTDKYSIVYSQLLSPIKNQQWDTQYVNRKVRYVVVTGNYYLEKDSIKFEVTCKPGSYSIKAIEVQVNGKVVDLDFAFIRLSYDYFVSRDGLNSTNMLNDDVEAVSKPMLLYRMVYPDDKFYNTLSKQKFMSRFIDEKNMSRDLAVAIKSGKITREQFNSFGGEPVSQDDWDSLQFVSVDFLEQAILEGFQSAN